MHRMKLFILQCVSYLPGWVGREADTRRLRRLRARNGPLAVAKFEACLATLNSSSVCIDLGANRGDYTEHLAGRGACVYAFEPDPWTFEQLKKRVGHLDNVVLIDAAASIRDEVVLMRRNVGFDSDPGRQSEGTSIVEFSPSLPIGSTFEAPSIDFLRFLRELDHEVDILKMDIEGAEVPLLEALVDAPECKKIRAAFVETHEVNIPDLRDRILALRQRLDPDIFNLDWP